MSALGSIIIHLNSKRSIEEYKSSGCWSSVQGQVVLSFEDLAEICIVWLFC